MPITVEATYEDGVFKPAVALSLPEHTKVQLTVDTQTSWAERTAGLLQWSGSVSDLRRIAEDDEFGIVE